MTDRYAIDLLRIPETRFTRGIELSFGRTSTCWLALVCFIEDDRDVGAIIFTPRHPIKFIRPHTWPELHEAFRA